MAPLSGAGIPTRKSGARFSECDLRRSNALFAARQSRMIVFVQAI
jgi:hypothetical protein